jgi:hypothetical protein
MNQTFDQNWIWLSLQDTDTTGFTDIVPTSILLPLTFHWPSNASGSHWATLKNYYKICLKLTKYIRGFDVLEVACWPLVPKFAGFKPGRSCRNFRARKILSTPFFGGEVKPSVPCRSFTACKKSVNVTWNSAFRQNCRKFLAHSSTFRRWVLSRGDTCEDAWWRRLEGLTQITQ